MKPISIDITPEILDKYTTDSSNITGLAVKGTEVLSCTVPNHLIGFPQLAVKILELFSLQRTDCDFRMITTDANKFGLVTIKGSSDNGDIFNLFRKFGILTGNLTIGLSGTPTEPVVYTTAKMMKDISKFAPEVQAALTFTLYNIAKICARVIVKIPNITRTSLMTNVNTDIPLSEVVSSFTLVRKIEVKELPTDKYTEIVYYNNKYSVLGTTYTGALCFNVLAETKSDGDIDYKNSAIISAISYSTTVYPVVINPLGMILTNMDLTNFESAKDSYITALTVPYTLPTIHVTNRPIEDIIKILPKNATLIDILNDTDLKETAMAECPKPLADWIANAKIPVHESLDDKACTAINKMFGLKAPVSVGAVDYATMVELYKDDEYAQQLYKQVKTYYDEFDLGNLSANLKGFAKGDLYSMLFAGGSGTGKSTAARVIPARCGIPYISINFSVNIEESDIFGSMIPNSMKASADDPEFVWQDGILTKAVRNGYCAVLEEINFARPGVLGKLNSLLDENRQIDLPTGEVLRAHPNFRIIATCNVAYEGTNRFNKALINRFDDCTVFKDVTRAKAIDIIKTRTGYKNMSKIGVIYNVYEALKKYGKEQNLNLIVSMRQLLNLFSKGKYYTDAKDAVCRIMLNGAFIEEPEYQEEFEKTVLPAFKLNFKI